MIEKGGGDIMTHRNRDQATADGTDSLVLPELACSKIQKQLLTYLPIPFDILHLVGLPFNI